VAARMGCTPPCVRPGLLVLGHSDRLGAVAEPGHAAVSSHAGEGVLDGVPEHLTASQAADDGALRSGHSGAAVPLGITAGEPGVWNVTAGGTPRGMNFPSWWNVHRVVSCLLWVMDPYKEETCVRQFRRASAVCEGRGRSLCSSTGSVTCRASCMQHVTVRVESFDETIISDGLFALYSDV
jgi:hypothetical protein